MKAIWILLIVLNSSIVLAGDYPCSKIGIEKALASKISPGQVESEVLSKLPDSVIQRTSYTDSPLKYNLDGNELLVWSLAKVEIRKCRSIKSLFLIKSSFVASLFFDKSHRLLATEVTGYHDSL